MIESAIWGHIISIDVFCLSHHLGGLSLKPQEAELRQRPDVVIATPGRLIDHVRNSPSFSLDSIEILVIDEADRYEHTEKF